MLLRHKLAVKSNIFHTICEYQLYFKIKREIVDLPHESYKKNKKNSKISLFGKKK